MNRILALVSIVLAGACGTIVQSAPDDGGPEAPTVSGTWRVEQGTFFQVDAAGSGIGNLDAIDYVSFDEANDGGAGTGEIFGSTAAGVLGCTTFVYATGDGQISLHAPLLSILTVSVAEIGENEITLVDAGGETTVLTRVEEIPAEAECKEANLQVLADLPAEPASFAGLFADQSLLRYTGQDDQIHTFDPTTGDFSATLFVGSQGSWRHFLAAQEGDFWGHCGCGGSEDAARLDDTGTIVDQIDTTLYTADGLSVRGIAVSSENVVLAGTDRQDDKNKLLVFDLAGDTLAQTVELPFRPSRIGFKGDELWATVSTVDTVIASYDLGSETSTATLVPPKGYFFQSFAWLDDSLYAIAVSTDGHYVLLGP